MGVIYKYPITGTVAPTALQALGVNTQVIEVGFADADTTAVITHNWRMSVADLAFFFPTISMYLELSGTGGPILATVIATLTNSVAVTLSKVGTAAGSAQTLVVVLQRPHSVSR
jgi:hypothetical protein